MTDPEKTQAETSEQPKTAEALIEALRELVSIWKRLSGLPTPVTFASLEKVGQPQKALWEAADDLEQLLAARTPLSPDDEARAWRLRVAASEAAKATCVCGSPDAYSLNPAEVLVHSVDAPCYIAEAQR